MKNLRALRFSKIPMRGDLRASMSVAGTLCTYCIINHKFRWEQLQNSAIQEISTRWKLRKLYCFVYLSFVVDKAPIYCFEGQIFCNIRVNQHTYKLTIGHDILERGKTIENYQSEPKGEATNKKIYKPSTGLKYKG